MPAEQHDPQALPVLPQQTPPQEGQLVFQPSWLPAPAQPQPSWPPASPQLQSSWPVTAQQPQAAWPVQRGAPPVQPMDLTPHLMPRTRSVNSVRPKFNGAAARGREPRWRLRSAVSQHAYGYSSICWRINLRPPHAPCIEGPERQVN